jgi:hypothetical protein
MSKLFVTVASLKAILVAASVALARGDMLSVILISVLFNLAQFGGKPAGQTVPRGVGAVSQSGDRGR